MNEKRRGPWLWILMKGQVFNTEAETLGKGPWTLLVLVIVVSTILAAFPFVNDRFTSALRSTNPSLYPGLVDVFSEIQKSDWNLAVVHGRLTVGPGVPGQARLGSWLVVFEPAGGDPQAIARAVGGSGTTVQKIAFFGTTHWGLLDDQTHSQFDGTWEKLEGFQTADLIKIPPARMLPILLYASATGGVVQTMYTIMLLMFAQMVFLTVMLGFLLSLSKVHAQGSLAGVKRSAGFLASLRTTGFVTLGPALLICLVLSFVPGGSGLSWIGFTLLFGMRIVFVYMGRFRNKKRPTERD